MDEINDRIVQDLLKYINLFDSQSENSVENLRGQVCLVLDLVNRPNLKFNLTRYSIREIDSSIQIAIWKLQYFGYKKINMNRDFFQQIDSPHHVITTTTIESFYKSDIFEDRILDGDQKKFLDFFYQENRVLLSAPTSFGKTFLLKEIILSKNYKIIVMIFPLNSLLDENLQEFRDLNSKMKNKYVIVTRPKNDFDFSHNLYLFILTPERFLLLLSLYPALNIDFGFMDEIYKISQRPVSPSLNIARKSRNDNRDSVFRTALYNLARVSKDLYIAGPYLSKNSFEEGMNEFLLRYEIKELFFKNEKVNKLFDSSWEKTKKYIDGLQEILESKANASYETFLVYVKDKNVLFKVAEKLSQNEFICNSYKPNNLPNSLLDEFCSHLRTTYKKNNQIWSLPYYLRLGIGLHCGTFPRYIQKQILDFFNGKVLKILISTTSIVEGVNVTARNLIFYSAYKANDSLSKFDIKNIEGRAGRYYHHFSAVIYPLSKKIQETKGQNDLDLDFVNFSSWKDISNLDVVNTETLDLKQERHKKLKLNIEKRLLQKQIPIKVVKQNYAVDWEQQISLVEKIRDIKHEENVNNRIINNLSEDNENSKFTEAIYEIIGILSDVFPTDFPPHIKHIYQRYRNSSLWGLVDYQTFKIKNEGRLSEGQIFEKALIKAMDQEKEVIQFLIPKYLNVFINLFNFVNNLNLSVTNIVNKFELEDNVEYLELYEYGIPLDTIRKLKKIDVKNIKNISVSYLEKGFTEYELALLRRLF